MLVLISAPDRQLFSHDEQKKQIIAETVRLREDNEIMLKYENEKVRLIASVAACLVALHYQFLCCWVPCVDPSFARFPLSPVYLPGNAKEQTRSVPNRDRPREEGP